MHFQRIFRLGAAACIVISLGVNAAWCQTPLVVLLGESSGGVFGSALSSAGDVDGDGLGDLIVGARRDDPQGPSSGSARVFSGRDGRQLFQFAGEAAGEQFGSAVGDAGDVDNDGFDDLIVGAPFADHAQFNAGRVRVFSGRDGSTLLVSDGDTQFGLYGLAVDGAGDLNGDGHADLVVGAPQEDGNGEDSGIVHLVSGATQAPIFNFTGDAAGDQLGRSVSGAGDVDNDGRDDFIAGANLNDQNGPNAGLARVYSGRTLSVLYTFLGDSAGDEFGLSVGRAGDVNNDGFDDLIVGAPRDDNNGIDSGSARVFSGRDGSILRSLHGDAAGDAFGSSVAGAGDVDGDGFGDLIVGAPGSDAGGVDAGLARVFSGRTGQVLADISGLAAGDRLGEAAAEAGDFDGDARSDVLVGASGSDLKGNDTGQARVYSAASGIPPVKYCTPLAHAGGRAAAIDWAGSYGVSDDNFHLIASDLPAQEILLFIYAPDQLEAPIGNGKLCIGPGSLGYIVRLPVLFSNSGGVAEHTLDLADPPALGGMIFAGSTWNFQAWFRDSAGAGFNFSDAIRVTFRP